MVGIGLEPARSLSSRLAGSAFHLAPPHQTKLETWEEEEMIRNSLCKELKWS